MLGRPFGLRQMARLGKNVALLRDMTDTSQPPPFPPFPRVSSDPEGLSERVLTLIPQCTTPPSPPS
eukprot:SAG31_NODE_5002_length_2807_cov_33.203471_5_plen_66_part_00